MIKKIVIFAISKVMCRHFIYERELRSCWHERKHIFCSIPFGGENNNKNMQQYIYLFLFIIFDSYFVLQCNIYLMSGYLYFCIHLFPFFSSCIIYCSIGYFFHLSFVERVQQHKKMAAQCLFCKTIE